MYYGYLLYWPCTIRVSRRSREALEPPSKGVYHLAGPTILAYKAKRQPKCNPWPVQARAVWYAVFTFPTIKAVLSTGAAFRLEGRELPLDNHEHVC